MTPCDDSNLAYYDSLWWVQCSWWLLRMTPMHYLVFNLSIQLEMLITCLLWEFPQITLVSERPWMSYWNGWTQSFLEVWYPIPMREIHWMALVPLPPGSLLCNKVSPHAGSSAQPFLMASPAALTPELSDVTLGSVLSVPLHHAFMNIHVTPNTTIISSISIGIFLMGPHD